MDPCSDRGFPLKCMCGLEAIILTSKTQENPRRPFFRCISKRDVKNRINVREEHLFKWVEEAVFEEVEDGKLKVRSIETEVYKAKSEVQELKAFIEELTQEIVWSKMEIKQCKKMIRLCFAWFCLVTIVIVIMVVGKAKETKFVVSY